MCCCSTNPWRAWVLLKPKPWCELLQALKKDHAMLLVEHDMDAVFALADVLTVMVNGTVIASGTP